MKSEIKDKWVAALRSGRYEQTRYTLMNKYGFCPLGVLCELHRLETSEIWEPSTYDPISYAYLGVEDVLPKEVVNWAGLTNDDPEIKTSSNVHLSISSLNDDARKSFSEIADLIESNF